MKPRNLSLTSSGTSLSVMLSVPLALVLVVLICLPARAGASQAVEFTVSRNPIQVGTQVRILVANEFGPVRLEVFDSISGQLKTLLFNQRSNTLILVWSGVDNAGRALEPGIYLLRFQYPGGAMTRKLVLLR